MKGKRNSVARLADDASCASPLSSTHLYDTFFWEKKQNLFALELRLGSALRLLTSVPAAAAAQRSRRCLTACHLAAPRVGASITAAPAVPGRPPRCQECLEGNAGGCRECEVVREKRG